MINKSRESLLYFAKTIKEPELLPYQKVFLSHLEGKEVLAIRSTAMLHSSLFNETISKLIKGVEGVAGR